MNIKSYVQKDVLAPFAAIYGVGFSLLLILPFMFSAVLRHFGITVADAGLLISVELGAMCLSSMLVAPVIDLFSKRLIILFGTALAISGNLLVMYVDSINLVYILFFLSGTGYGLALASGNASVASTSNNSDEIYNKVILLGTILMIVLLNLFPRLISMWGFTGAMTGLIVLHVIMVPAIWQISPSRKTKEKEYLANNTKKTILLKPISFAIVLMTFFYFARDTMVWVFAENIGSTRLNMTGENIGLLFSIHGAMSLFGPLLLLWLMSKYDKGFLLISGIAVTGIITIWISHTDSVVSYSFLAIIWSSAHFFTYSCIMGFATRADKKGRIAAATGAAVMGGNAVAPALAGYAMDLGGNNLFSIYVLAAFIATLICGAITIFFSNISNRRALSLPE